MSLTREDMRKNNCLDIENMVYLITEKDQNGLPLLKFKCAEVMDDGE